MNKAINTFKYLLFIFMASASSLGYASGTGFCTPVGGPHIFNYDATYDITRISQNVPGTKFKDVFKYSLPERYKMHCDETEPLLAWIYQSSPLMPSSIEGSVWWFKLNDYLQVSMKGYVAGRVKQMFDLPFNETNQYTLTSKDGFWDSGGRGSISLKITKPFVGDLYENKMVAFASIAIGDKSKSSTGPHASELWVHFHIISPQSCSIDAGNMITMDYGNIGAPLFSQAGAGNKPAGVNPKTHNIAVKCKGIDAQSLLSMRLEADNVSGNAIVSDNKDVGFIVAGNDKVPLTPNGINSKIHFQLDDNSSAMVPITAWPVSITGKKPAEGRFTAEGYLRIDFD
jgi:minor fimbrial subunit